MLLSCWWWPHSVTMQQQLEMENVLFEDTNRFWKGGRFSLPRFSCTMQEFTTTELQNTTFLLTYQCPIFINTCIIEAVGEKHHRDKNQTFSHLKKTPNCMMTDLEIQTWNSKRPETLFITVWTSQQLVTPLLTALDLNWLIPPIAFLINGWKAAYSAQFNSPLGHQKLYTRDLTPMSTSQDARLRHNPPLCHQRSLLTSQHYSPRFIM